MEMIYSIASLPFRGSLLFATAEAKAGPSPNGSVGQLPIWNPVPPNRRFLLGSRVAHPLR